MLTLSVDAVFSGSPGDDDDGIDDGSLNAAVEAQPPGGIIGVWTIEGRTVNVTDATELQEADGPLV